ncbi:TolC family protein [Ferrovibrio xuzhouensis]|uniref:TolC family protein n=1 Tax=Ferrovibrio xuzhouensis TaxID=1576914 RepID=A0ABV7V9B0_9PROT
MSTASLRCAHVCATLLLSLWAGNTLAQAALGADLGAMLAYVRSQHPDVAAATLETDAAAARASAADSLPDPEAMIEFNNNTWPGSAWSNQDSNRTYKIEQRFPLGGKRTLRRAIADAEKDETDGRRRSLAEDLALRVKIVQARRYAAVARMRLLQEQHALLRHIVELADHAYAQGRGTQNTALAVRLNLSWNEIETSRLGGEQRQLDARLSGLLGLDSATGLLPPPGFAPLPLMDGIDADSLLVLARERNPDLAQQATRIASGEQKKRLADAEWIPDVSLGVRAVEEDGRPRAYEGIVSFNIPLRWGLRDARQAEATAETSAARARRTAIDLDLAAGLREALAALATQRRIEILLMRQALPQAKAATETALRALEQGDGQVTDVLLAESRWRDLGLEQVQVQSAQREMLAQIERDVGGEL